MKVTDIIEILNVLPQNTDFPVNYFTDNDDNAWEVIIIKVGPNKHDKEN
jgi:hypothetical protein